MARLQLTSDANADALLSEDPFALLVGMLLDQQIAMEVAFAGPRKIADRLGGLDARLIAEADPEAFAALCAQTPAVHRFPASMAKRIQELARAIVGGYDGDAAAVWNSGDPDAAEVLRSIALQATAASDDVAPPPAGAPSSTDSTTPPVL